MVTISNSAKNDLKEIHNYIAGESKFYANNLIEEIISKIDSLKDYSDIRRVVPEMNDSAIMEVYTNSYRVIYQLSGEDVEILAILYSGTDLPNSK